MDRLESPFPLLWRPGNSFRDDGSDAHGISYCLVMVILLLNVAKVTSAMSAETD